MRKWVSEWREICKVRDAWRGSVTRLCLRIHATTYMHIWRFKLFVCVCVTIAKVCPPVQYLRGPFKTLRGVTATQSSASACDSIVSGPPKRQSIRIKQDQHIFDKDGAGRGERRYVRAERDGTGVWSTGLSAVSEPFLNRNRRHWCPPAKHRECFEKVMCTRGR